MNKDIIDIALLAGKGDINPDKKGIGSGSLRYINELYENLNKLYTKNITYNISVRTPKDLPLLKQRLSFSITNSLGGFGNADIIHNLDPRIMLPLRKRKTLWVTSAHELRAHSLYINNTLMENRLRYTYLHELGIRLALLSDCLIVSSTQTRDEAIKLGYNKKIYVINLGIDKRFLSPILSKESKKINDKFIVGYVGRMALYKNVDFAIRAIKAIDNKDIELRLYGSKPKNMGYESIIKEIDGSNNIKLMGFAPEETLVNIYDTFDAYVHPTIYTGFELEILEAQARGKPVIIYKGGNVPKEVKKYCFEAEDEQDMGEILNELKENGYDTSKKDAAMKYARQFTWEKTAQQTLEAYSDMLRNHI